jgi:hypothetical protein
MRADDHLKEINQLRDRLIKDICTVAQELPADRNGFREVAVYVTLDNYYRVWRVGIGPAGLLCFNVGRVDYGKPRNVGSDVAKSWDVRVLFELFKAVEDAAERFRKGSPA